MKQFAYAASKAHATRGDAGGPSLHPQDLLSTMVSELGRPFHLGTVLKKERYCQFRPLFIVFSSWRCSNAAAKQVSSTGAVQKSGDTFLCTLQAVSLQ